MVWMLAWPRLNWICSRVPNFTAIPANLLNEGLAATDGKQYSFFVRN